MYMYTPCVSHMDRERLMFNVNYNVYLDVRTHNNAFNGIGNKLIMNFTYNDYPVRLNSKGHGWLTSFAVEAEIGEDAEAYSNDGNMVFNETEGPGRPE